MGGWERRHLLQDAAFPLLRKIYCGVQILTGVIKTENQPSEQIFVMQAAWFKNSEPEFESIICDWLKTGYRPLPKPALPVEVL